MILVWGWTVAWNVNDKLDDLMSDEFYLETQGRFTRVTLSKDGPFNYSEVVRELASSGASDVHHYRLLGHLAFRDERFFFEGSSSAKSLYGRKSQLHIGESN